MKQVTVLILNWNGKKWMEQFLPSVLSSTYPSLEIVVADNGSTDDSLAFLAANYPSIRTIVFEENHGFTEGNNRAVKQIDSPYIVLLNNDVEVESGWIEPLVAIMDARSEVAAVQPRIRAQLDKSSFEYAGAAGGYIDRFAYPFCRGRIFDTLEQDEGQYESVAEIFWATGACCMIRKSVIEKIGLFEPAFFAHMEEIDFCWRAQNAGYAIMCEPASVVYHVGGGSLPQGNPRKTFLNVRNSLAMMYKNLPTRNLFPRIFMRLVLDGVWGIRALFSWEWGTIWAIIRAHFDFYGKLGLWQQRRNELHAEKDPQLPVTGYFSGSIVWEYFVKGKKIFRKLKFS